MINEDDKSDSERSTENPHVHVSLQGPSDKNPRPEDMEAAAELVIALDVRGEVSSPKETSEIAEQIDPTPSERTTPVDENESSLNEETARADEEIPTEDMLDEDNIESVHEVAAEEARLRPSRDVRLPGAYAVPGPGVEGGEEETVNTPSASTADVAVLAHLVDDDEENRILSQRIEEALREEREHAAVAEVMSQSIDSPASSFRWCSKKYRWLGVIGFIMVAAAVIVAVMVVTQEEQLPTFETSSTPAPPVTKPLQRLQEEGTVMRLVGIDPLDSVAQSIWEEETGLFILGNILDEVFPDELRVSVYLVLQDPPFEGRQLQTLQSGEVNIEFDTEISITSSIEEHDAFDYIVGAFDTKEEESAFVDVLKETRHSAFANLTSVQVNSGTKVGDPLLFALDHNLSISLLGVSPLSTDSWDSFEEAYTSFCYSFYKSIPQYGINSLSIELDFVSQDPSSRHRQSSALRALQVELDLVFNQDTSFAAGDGSHSVDVVTQPFVAETSRNSFAAHLRESDDSAFANIQGVSPLTRQEEE